MSSTLSLRGKIAAVTVVLAGLGLGAAPLASAAPAAVSTAAGVPVLKVAANYKGVPYRWGGTTTHGFDCSGYVQFVFKKLGVKLPRTAEEQYEATKHITRGQLQLGDLVFYGRPGSVYHVGIYAGNNMFWDAPHTGDRVRLQKVWAGTKVYGRVRGLPAVVIATATAAATPVPILLAPAPTPTDSTDPASDQPAATPTSPAATPATSAPAATPSPSVSSATPSASASTVMGALGNGPLTP